jgi:outer membrane protein TolC
LSEKKVEIETEKLKAGRSTNFQLVSFQNDLVNAQNGELAAITTYLNALTSLDRTLGITLDKWGVSLTEHR